MELLNERFRKTTLQVSPSVPTPQGQLWFSGGSDQPPMIFRCSPLKGRHAELGARRRAECCPEERERTAAAGKAEQGAQSQAAGAGGVCEVQVQGDNFYPRSQDCAAGGTARAGGQVRKTLSPVATLRPTSETSVAEDPVGLRCDLPAQALGFGGTRFNKTAVK